VRLRVGMKAPRQHGYNEISIAAALLQTSVAHPCRSSCDAPFDVWPKGLPTAVTLSLRLLYVVLLLLLGTAVRADTLADIETLHKQGQSDQALQQADAAIALQPRAAPIRFLKGVLLGELGRKDEAMAVYLALTEDFPELADPYNNLAVLYADAGRLDAAVRALQQALRNDPKHLRARENLGDVYLALAIQAWQAAEVQSKGEDTKLLRKLKQAEAIAPKSVPQASPPPQR
jgi:tetratricopeptide (TPR) repeat protein